MVSLYDALTDARHPSPTPDRYTGKAKVVWTMTKPSKPTPDYPFFTHSNGQSAKKVKRETPLFRPVG